MPRRARAGYFGPEGTFTHEALLAAAGTAATELELIPVATIYDAVMGVHEGELDRALVPIENSLEGSVNVTLDALALEAEDVAILGEVVHPVRHCLIARSELELGDVEVVVSHPQATAQCTRFIRSELPRARVIAGGSTAEAVKMVAAEPGPWAALGNRVAAERYGCVVLRDGVEDEAGNATRFVWLGPVGGPVGGPASDVGPAGALDEEGERPWKTAIVFWGAGSESPGWLVACLAEFAERGVNLTRIESRPRKLGLGQYMFFADLDGRDGEAAVDDALAGLRRRVERLRILGSYPTA